jgi:hypothetical protein
MSSTPVTLRNANDTYVVAGVPAANYSNATSILTKSAGTGSQVNGLIYFARGFPFGVTIVSATLKLYQVGAEAGSHTIKLQRITGGTWNVSNVTWNNQPTSTATGEVSLTQGAAGANTEWAFNVTSHIQLIADGNTAWYGWKIVSTTDDYLSFWSTQAATFKPVLEITYSDKPQAPSTLSPSGNRAVSVAKPILRFDFTDEAGNTTLQSVQVQVNATNVWTSPTFDSGTVASSDAQLDLSATAYAGLSSGSSTWWRVRVQDGAGLWSDWSLGAQFQRQTQGTLALSNPPGTGLISEPTPPITWSLTSRTQKAYQVFITRGTTVVYNTGKITGATTSRTLPDGILKDDTSYKAYVRTWDTIDRESTPNDPPYVEASQTFTYNYDVTVNPVTSLAATDLSPVPAVQLTWSRATAPDTFIIRRDGVIVASNLTSASLSTGGTNYAYTDRGGDPRRPVQWRVDAVAGGKTSASNPTVTKTLNPLGTWLQDFERGIYVQLLDRTAGDGGSWTMGEEAETHTPVGATAGVRITQSLRGFEGSVTGKIVAGSLGAVAVQEANWYLLKSTPGRVYQLTLSNFTIPVVIGNVVVAPVAVPELMKQVTFNFWQTGSLPFTADV